MKKIILFMTACLLVFVKEDNVRAETYFDRLPVLTAMELDLYTEHPWMAAKAKKAASDAEAATEKYWKGYTSYQGNGDAFRHSYWSALMTKRISRDFAYEAGLAHEGLKKGYSFDALEDDNKMDISNNYSGRIIGDKYSNYSDAVIRDILISRTQKGYLKRVRVYSKTSAGCQKYSGVWTKYKGYYVVTNDGGYKFK